jgi:hypothetical protein
MKRRSFLLFLLLVTATISFAQRNSLVGTWKLVSSKTTMNDSTTVNENKGETMKIITPTHFALLSKDADGTLQYAGGGRVVMDNNSYTETVEYFSDKSMLNQKAVFTYKMEGAKCHFNGSIGAVKIDEVWQRVQ